MNVSEIDKNLEVKTNINKTDIKWLNASLSPFKIYGAFSTEPYTRMPLDTAKSVSDGVYFLSKHTSGIRVRFRTDSPYIAIHCERNNRDLYSHMPQTGQSGFDLFSYDRNSKTYSFVRTFIPPIENENGYDSIIDVSGKMSDYIINFPLYNTVDKLYIGVSDKSNFEESSEYINNLPVVFYGSSITQGGCASRPGNSYQNFLSRSLDIDYINLGFSGSGRAEDNMIKYLAGLEMSAFVSDYDHNAPNEEHLNNTHYKLYKNIREKHPDIPYIIVSKPDYHTGLSIDDKRRTIIFDTFKKALSEGDKNVYFIDGASLFAGNEWDACTVDGCHPNDLGFYRFSQALYPVLKTALFK